MLQQADSNFVRCSIGTTCMYSSVMHEGDCETLTLRMVTANDIIYQYDYWHVGLYPEGGSVWSICRRWTCDSTVMSSIPGRRKLFRPACLRYQAV